MDVTPIKIEPNSVLRLAEDGHVNLWRVVKRIRGGYRLIPFSGGDTRTITDDTIFDLRFSHKLECYPGDPDLDPDHIKYVLSRTFAAFPEMYKIIAERRAVYVEAVDAMISDGSTLAQACMSVPEAILQKHQDEWRVQNAEYAGAIVAVGQKRRRMPMEEAWRRATERASRLLIRATPDTLATWYRLWTNYDRDIRVLIPAFPQRGDHSPRFDTQIYADMRECLQKYFFISLKPTVTYAYKRFEAMCKARGLEMDKNTKGRDRLYPTYVAFRNFKDKIKTDYEETKDRDGPRAAYLTYNVFQKVTRSLRVLEEIEIDHCLIDLIAVDEISGRPIGRPWLTATLDRASRMILGAHLSFEVPSYAAVQRCLAHSFWGKDLRGLGLRHNWITEGLPDRLFTDNGKEFHSRSLKRSAQELRFDCIPLPVMTPWLKGSVERLWGRVNVQVFGHRVGKTFSNSKARGNYRPHERAEIPLAQVRRDLLEWIVDDYQVTEHSGLGKATPLGVWQELVERQGGVRPVPRYGQIIELTGEITFRKIENDGIDIHGLSYFSRDLADLRKRRGGLNKKYEIRYDPFDMGEIWVLDELEGRHLTIPCTDQEISRGVSEHAAKIHLKIARASGSLGRVTQHDIKLAKNKAEAESDQIFRTGKILGPAKAAARYHGANAEYFTPLTAPTPPSCEPLPPVPAPEETALHGDVRPTAFDAAGAHNELVASLRTKNPS